MLAQLAARVVQGLVQRATCGVEPLRQHVDRYPVQSQSDQDATLVRRQDLLDRPLDGGQELAQVCLRRGPERGAREQSPRLWLERDLPSLPGRLRS